MKHTTLISVLGLGLLPVAGLVVWLVLDGQLERLFSDTTGGPAKTGHARVARTLADGSTNQPAASGYLALQRIPLHARPTNTSPVLASLEAGTVITNSVTNGWIAVSCNGQRGWVEARQTEPFTTAGQYRTLTLMIKTRGETSPLSAVATCARALARLDRKTLSSVLAERVYVVPPKGRPAVFDKNDFVLLPEHARILWLLHDEALTLRGIGQRAARLASRPVTLASNTTTSNASGIRLGLARQSGRWLVERIILDNTHPLLLD